MEGGTRLLPKVSSNLKDPDSKGNGCYGEGQPHWKLLLLICNPLVKGDVKCFSCHPMKRVEILEFLHSFSRSTPRPF